VLADVHPSPAFQPDGAATVLPVRRAESILACRPSKLVSHPAQLLVLHHGRAPSAGGGGRTFRNASSGEKRMTSSFSDCSSALTSQRCSTKHIVGFDQGRAVQPNLRKGGETVQPERDALTLGCRLGREADSIPPFLGVELARRRIEAPLTAVAQAARDSAGNAGWQPADGPSPPEQAPAVTDVPTFPSVAKRGPLIGIAGCAAGRSSQSAQSGGRRGPRHAPSHRKLADASSARLGVDRNAPIFSSKDLLMAEISEKAAAQDSKTRSLCGIEPTQIQRRQFRGPRRAVATCRTPTRDNAPCLAARWAGRS